MAFLKSKKTKGKAAVPRRRLPIEIDDSDSLPSSQKATTSASQFRRNQTLSSYRHNTPEESSRQKAHHLALQRRRLGGIMLIVVAAAVLLLLLLWQLMAQVHVVTSTKQLAEHFQAAPYESSINEYLALNPAQRLRFTLNQDALSNFVSSQLPEVEKVALSGSAGLARATFSITFRTPVAGWQINSRQNYVDANGVVFEKNYYSVPSVQIVDENGIGVEQGAAVASSRLLGFMGRVVAGAGERGYTVTKAILPAGTTRQVEITIKDKKTRVKFSVDRGAGEQVEDMDRALQYFALHRMNISELDVRVSGKAAYR